MFPVLAGSNPSGYNLTNSLRFRASASAYLNRTPASSSSQSRYTLSFWIKRGTLGANQTLLSCVAYGNASYQTYFRFNSSDQLEFYNSWGSDLQNLITTQVFRDPSAWYHIVFAINMNGATRPDAIQISVNGSLITAFSTTTYINVFQATAINAADPHNIFRNVNTSSLYTDGYLEEVNFVDGQQLTPSSFGSTNPVTGVWQPRKYGGTYGTNGYYLPFTDNSALTTSSNVGLGRDYSGNGNYWATNNISITSGTTYDSMTDVPTLTSATTANFCVANPLDKQTDIAVAQGNLQISTSAGAGNKQIRGSIALPSTGKFYWETKNTGSANNFNMGLTTLTASLSTEGAGDMFYNENGVIGNNGTNTSGYSTLALNDIVGVAVDIDANKIYWYKNNTLVNSGGTTINITAPFAPMFGLYTSGNAQNVNFGQQPFTYTPPTGYVALNAYNLPTSTIVKGNTVMDATTYSGNGTTLSVVNAAGFKPDLVWLKSRSAATDHELTDSVRGVTKSLTSNSTAAEATDVQGLTAFNSNGFTVGTNTNYNNLAATYVGWQWQAGQGSTSSNTNGTITSTVSVNASAGFSIVTYTGNGSNSQTVGHGLGVTPAFIVVKGRGNVDNWWSWHVSLGTGSNAFILNGNGQAQSYTNIFGSGPTSSIFNIQNGGGVNNSGTTFVAYCWTPIAGLSAFGSYTGNGSTDGPFIYTGFRPKYFLIKCTSTGGAGYDWYVLDSVRNPYNYVINYLYPNYSNAEDSSGGPNYSFDFVSNGIKIRGNGAGQNQNGQTFAYIAFAENPFKNALAR